MGKTQEKTRRSTKNKVSVESSVESFSEGEVEPLHPGDPDFDLLMEAKQEDVKSERVSLEELAKEYDIEIGGIEPTSQKAKKGNRTSTPKKTPKKVPLKKYPGVYFYEGSRGKVYYYTLNTIEHGKKKKVWVKVGSEAEGITAAYANQKMIAAKNDINHGELPTALKKKQKRHITTLDDISKIYFMHSQRDNRNYKRDLRRYEIHIQPVLGHMEAAEIKPEQIDQLQNDTLKTYSPRMAKSLVDMLTTIYNKAIEAEKLTVNPAKRVKKVKVENRVERYLKKEECAQLIEATKANEIAHTFTLLALSTGARRGALLQIRKRDIDLIQKTVKIKDEKGGGTYQGYLTDEVVEHLAPRLEKLTPGAFVVWGEEFDQDPKKITGRINYIMAPYLEQFNEGIDPKDRKNRVTIHTLRHTFASLLAISGIPLQKLQKLMNHKDITMTLRYAKLAPDSGQDEVNRLFKSIGV